MKTDTFPKHYRISADLLQQTINYLLTRPAGEVIGLLITLKSEADAQQTHAPRGRPVPPKA